MKPLWLAVLGAATVATGANAPGATATGYLAAAQRARDFQALCDFIGEEYAYLEPKRIQWPAACLAHAADAMAAADRDAYLEALEQTLAEIYDHHAHFGTNTAVSPRLVPTGSQLLARWHGPRAVIEAVRDASPAAAAGLRAGDEIISVQDVAVAAATAAFMPRAASAASEPLARDWALNVAVTGRRNLPDTRLRIVTAGGERNVVYSASLAAPLTRIESRREGDVGYLRIHNSLGETGLIADFDRELDRLEDSRALIIDLRETPSGGISAVARGIMGRFVMHTQPYQRHELIAEQRLYGVRRIWVEYVAPRPPAYARPVLVLVSPWTGSMGEGIAIGLDAAAHVLVVGEPMAGLRGALDQTELPESHFVVRIPAERLMHVDGTPREEFRPCTLRTTASQQSPADAELDSALALAAQLAHGTTTLAAARRRCQAPVAAPR